ncbi:outer membrane lipoprotein chaperone LolA [Pleionea sediminis]|uniref:outer membrane lipoprotein chaperone LolA n=1 Tax=Pleionea sediminis TaxID=2569479 RepID=UPI0013DE4DCE|nr:outer membrane lipoprotein chaperone LolA [Pleionea sediminis]
MTLKNWFKYCVVLLTAVQVTYASDADKLVDITKDITSVSAEFEQEIRDQFNNLKDKSKGVFQLKKPFKFLWQTQKPFQQLIVSNGDVLWTFDQDLDQVNIESLDKAMGNTPVFFLGADAKTLNESFNITLLPSGQSDAKTFELTPRNNENTFERMLVLFNDGQLKEILLKDTLGQQTSVEFSAVNMNVELADSTFEFTPPEGVDVLDSRRSKPSPTQPPAKPVEQY